MEILNEFKLKAPVKGISISEDQRQAFFSLDLSYSYKDRAQREFYKKNILQVVTFNPYLIKKCSDNEIEINDIIEIVGHLMYYKERTSLIADQLITIEKATTIPDLE